MTHKLAGGAGVLAFALPSTAAVAVAPMWDIPGTGSTDAEILEFVVAHRTALLVAMLAYIVSVTLWLLFGAGVWLVLRERGETLASACFALGTAGFVTLLLAGFTPFTVMAYRAPDVSEPRLLLDATFGLLAMSGPLTALALGGYAACVLQTGVLPRWTAVLAIVSAVAHVVLLASFVVEEGFFSLEGQVITVIPGTLFVWILGTGVALLRPLPQPPRTGGLPRR